LGGALLSVWGASPHDVYAVGGPLGDGGEAVVVHFDGTAWKKLSPGGADSFWWVYGSAPDDVWMVGENGRITHYDGVKFEELPRPATATLWGVWAASKTDAWIVGGTPGKGMAAPNDLVFHWDGSTWANVPLPMQLGRSLNKVWGTSSDDLYAVGEAATIWHKVGANWRLETNPAKSNLLTLFGCSSKDVYAVGGKDVLHSDGTLWSPVDVKLTNAVNGVTCDSAMDLFLVGFGGLKERRVGGKWTNEFSIEPYGDLHGSWAEGNGVFWAAGGDFVASPKMGNKREGILARYAKGTIPTLP
jgi:hypothetical protein